jgi:hypothetical protein
MLRTAGEQVRVEFVSTEKAAGKTKKKPYRQSIAKRI